MLNLLEARAISRYENGRCLLHPTTAAVPAGARIALSGASGSGKSVLMRALASIEPIQSGEICYRGTSISAIHPEAWRQHIALISQTALMVQGTAEDNLRLPYQFQYHRGRRFDRQFHLQHLEALGKTAALLEQDAAKLSGGERQLINLLRALQLQPDILLLDEPTAALDAGSKAQVEALIARWHNAHPERAYIWISHDASEAAAVGSTHWHMQAGKLA